MNYKVAARQNGERHKKCHRTDIGQTAQVNTQLSASSSERSCRYALVNAFTHALKSLLGLCQPRELAWSRGDVSISCSGAVASEEFGDAHAFCGGHSVTAGLRV